MLLWLSESWGIIRCSYGRNLSYHLCQMHPHNNNDCIHMREILKIAVVISRLNCGRCTACIALWYIHQRDERSFVFFFLLVLLSSLPLLLLDRNINKHSEVLFFFLSFFYLLKCSLWYYCGGGNQQQLIFTRPLREEIEYIQ